jgi:hypothetical protein
MYDGLQQLDSILLRNNQWERRIKLRSDSGFLWGEYNGRNLPPVSNERQRTLR